MKVGILGTRGIPNQYGGFEQWAEYLSQGLIKRGCEVTVYNSHFHPFREDNFNGVKIIHRWDPKRIGLASQFLYDFLCIIDARKQNFDAIIQLGYTTSAVWAWLLPGKAKILYNMDGMEWKREKYKGILKTFLKYAEKLAVKHSDVVIADAKPIQSYFENKYNANVHYIAYPAQPFSNPDKALIQRFKIKAKEYHLLIARFQPDNNLELVIQGVLQSNTSLPLLIVGEFNNKFGRYLRENYPDERIVFLGRNFDKEELDNLRYYSSVYFHGHSAGGTNPSLLEAMATSCLICAHDNEFNKSVLENDAYYFSRPGDISNLLDSKNLLLNKELWIDNNQNKIHTYYNMDLIINKYQELL